MTVDNNQVECDDENHDPERSVEKCPSIGIGVVSAFTGLCAIGHSYALVGGDPAPQIGIVE